MKPRRYVARMAAVAVVVAGAKLAVSAPAYAFPMTKVYVSGTELVVDDMATGSDLSVVITATKGGWHMTGLNIYPMARCSFVSASRRLGSSALTRSTPSVGCSARATTPLISTGWHRAGD